MGDGLIGTEYSMQLTGEDLQGCIQGNLCRCTGYRPIHDVGNSRRFMGKLHHFHRTRRRKMRNLRIDLRLYLGHLSSRLDDTERRNCRCHLRWDAVMRCVDTGKRWLLAIRWRKTLTENTTEYDIVTIGYYHIIWRHSRCFRQLKHSWCGALAHQQTNELVSLCTEIELSGSIRGHEWAIEGHVRREGWGWMSGMGRDGTGWDGMGMVKVVVWFRQKSNIQKISTLIGEYVYRSFSRASLLIGWGSQPASNSHGDASWWANVDTWRWTVWQGESAMDHQFSEFFTDSSLMDLRQLQFPWTFWSLWTLQVHFRGLIAPLYRTSSMSCSSTLLCRIAWW